ncbi:hypothetical protein JCM10213_003415 [Rhodosporidiobolus nylandii]
MPVETKKGARKQKKASPLLTLPPAILSQILAYKGVISAKNVALNRALLPYTLHAMFSYVRLTTAEQLSRFCAALVRQPDLVEKVEALHIGPQSGKNYKAPDESAWAMKGESESLFAELLSSSRRSRPPYSPTTFVANLNLLGTLVSSLPNLTHLSLIGHALLSLLTDVSYLQEKPLSRVQILEIKLLLFQDWNFPAAETVLHDLAIHLPHLRTLYIRHNMRLLPLTLLNVSSSAILPPRAWPLHSFVLKCILTPPEFRTLLSAFSSPSLTSLTLTLAMGPYAGFMADLARLPHSLRVLRFYFGTQCGEPDRKPFPSFASDGSLHLPNLEHLVLSGNIVSAATFETIRSFPSLRHLEFGPHARFTAGSLLPLVADTKALPLLACLHLDICECRVPDLAPLRQSKRLRPVWQAEFGSVDAGRVVRAAEERGLWVEGTVLCALKRCEVSNWHECPGWYK